MAAPEGNRFWEARASHGRKAIYDSADDLWEDCVEYFEWVEGNPLQEETLVTFQGKFKRVDVPKMRAMTMEGLCRFLEIGTSTWADWRKPNHDFSEVVARAESVIREQKFTGAAAGFLNPNIIARDLGLSDKSELTGKNGGPINTKQTLDLSNLSPEQLAAIASIRLPADSE